MPPRNPVQHFAHQPDRLVLLVDDSAAQRQVLAVQLRRAGYRVEEAGTAAEALDFCAKADPDFIISDWVMPGMEGPDFCRSYRQHKRDSYCYFILLTSKGDKNDLTEGLASGADDFLVKPVAGAELLARMSAGDRILTMHEKLRGSNQQLLETLTRLRETQDEMDRDLREARKLQQGLVKERNVRFEDFEISLLLRPTGHIGGDLVGFFRIDATRVGIYALDVSGHGVTAALLTARLAAHFVESVGQNIALFVCEDGSIDAYPPLELACRLNAMMIKELRTDSYLTMIYAQLDTASGELRLVQCGHPHPMVQRRSGEMEKLGNGGLPIGVFAGAEFEEVRTVLEDGDRLLLVSDGITEAADARGRQLGEEGLRAILTTNATLTGTVLLESLAWSVTSYARGNTGDDVSALLIEHRRLAAAAAPRKAG